MQLAAPFQRREREMAGVGFRAPGGVPEAGLLGLLAHLRIAHVMMDVGEFLGPGALRPYALRATEIRNTLFGRNAGAREHDDPRRPVHPAPHLFHVHGVAQWITSI